MHQHTSVIPAFLDDLAAHGIRLADPSNVTADGRIHRTNVEGDRRNAKNLAYKIHDDDRPAWWFQDHKRGITASGSLRVEREQPTAEQRAAWAAKAAERRAEIEREYDRAAARASELYAAAGPVDPAHPYLVRKGLTNLPASIRQDADGRLVIPVYTDFGRLSSLQFIAPDGDKLFLTGGRMQGGFFPINGTDRSRVLAAEGVATGLALASATGCSVACAMSAGNLPAIVALLRAKFPERETVACADNDHGTEARTGTNPGIAAAAGILPPVRIVAPDFPSGAAGTDWDDWLRAGGSQDELRARIEGRPAPAPPPADETAASAEPERRQPVDAPLTGEVQTLPQPPASTASMISVWESLGLACNASHIPYPNLDNVVRVLFGHPELVGRIWYDEFLQRTLTTWPSGEPEEWSEKHDNLLTVWIQRTVGISKIGTLTVAQAASVAAQENRRNECREWLQGLRWDGTPRLRLLIPLGFGGDASPYTEAVGRCWLVSMVARALSPGCKVDTMPVFEGMQGRGKSSALQALVGARWFAEASESPTSKDFFQALHGKLLVEIGEMDSFSRSEVHTIKRVITCQTDRFRAPYGRRAEDHPRQGVFAGTTNRDDWNRDETGARRFWPVTTGAVDLAWIKRQREQLFAEAVHRYQAGESWWDVPTEDAEREQEARRQSDEWEEPVALWLTGRAEVTTGDVLEHALKITLDRWTRADQMRVGVVMRVLGWQRIDARRGGRVKKIWVRGSDK